MLGQYSALTHLNLIQNFIPEVNRTIRVVCECRGQESRLVLTLCDHTDGAGDGTQLVGEELDEARVEKTKKKTSVIP